MRPRLHRLLVPALAAVLALGAVPASATAPDAEPQAVTGLSIGRLYFDPPGDDLPATNTKINKEYVVVKNTSKSSRNLAGFSIKDAANHTFVFPKGFTLKAGTSVTVRTGKGTNTSSTLYWKQGNYVWNNTGDTARLLTPGKAEVDTCTYKKNAKGWLDC